MIGQGNKGRPEGELPAMSRHRSLLSFAGPSLVVSFVLFGMCIVAGIYLYVQQSMMIETLGEDVESRRHAHDLETNLKAMSTSISKNQESIEELHEEAERALAECNEHANRRRERELVGRLNASFNRFTEMWDAHWSLDGKKRTDAITAARNVLESETLPLCRELRSFNSNQIDKSEKVHRGITHWLLPALVVVGIFGSLNGIYFGYIVARRVRRSVYQLSVSVRDAANRLGQETPSVMLIEDGNLRSVNRQMKGVVEEIQALVERLQQRDREIMRADRLAAVGQLAAGIAHELRNPLTSISMLVQTIRAEAEERGVPAEDLELIEQEIRRMDRCLQNFLDFARPPKLERQPVELAAVVERSLALVAGRARQNRVQVKFQPPRDVPAITGDAGLLQQLLINLLLNALDAMPGGGILEIQLEADSAGQVVLSVLDSGHGIRMLDRLFEPFASTKETGLGLGLCISRRIAESHGGTLIGSNRPEGGACFQLSLPAEPVIARLAV